MFAQLSATWTLGQHNYPTSLQQQQQQALQQSVTVTTTTTPPTMPHQHHHSHSHSHHHKPHSQSQPQPQQAQRNALAPGTATKDVNDDDRQWEEARLMVYRCHRLPCILIGGWWLVLTG
jgi:hypothetical protein